MNYRAISGSMALACFLAVGMGLYGCQTTSVEAPVRLARAGTDSDATDRMFRRIEPSHSVEVVLADMRSGDGPGLEGGPLYYGCRYRTTDPELVGNLLGLLRGKVHVVAHADKNWKPVLREEIQFFARGEGGSTLSFDRVAANQPDVRGTFLAGRVGRGEEQQVIADASVPRALYEWVLRVEQREPSHEKFYEEHCGFVHRYLNDVGPNAHISGR